MRGRGRPAPRAARAAGRPRGRRPPGGRARRGRRWAPSTAARAASGARRPRADATRPWRARAAVPLPGARARPGRSRRVCASAAREWAAQDDEVWVDGERADVLGPAGPGLDHGDGARVELLAERGDGGLDAGGVVGAPLRDRRVAGVVHADET